MKSGILIVFVITVFASGILAVPSWQLNGKPKHDVLTKPKTSGVYAPNFDALFEQYTTSIDKAYDVLLFASLEAFDVIETNANVSREVIDIFNPAFNKMLDFVEQTYFALSPNDTLEDTALLIDVTVVRSTLLLVKYGKAIEDVVARDAAHLLPTLKSINKQAAENVEKEIEPLVALVREILP